MKTFLFAWNPKKWIWTTLDQSIEQIENTGIVKEKWRVVAHTKISPGDRAFLIRLGKYPKGIMASGFVASTPFLSPHWSGENKLVHRVMIDFEVILNGDNEPLLELDVLNTGNLSKVNWTPQASGVEINPEITAELEAVWFDFLTTKDKGYKPFRSAEEDAREVYTEGGPNQIVVTKYERNPHARKACLDYYGYSCSVCGFNFELSYGEIGKDYIHVHHIRMISSAGQEHAVDPIRDLRPVCPNCHAMIHVRKDPFSVKDIKDRMGLPNK